MKPGSLIWALLLPLSAIVALFWSMGSKIRNFLYDFGFLKSTVFQDVFLINVGNLAVGGSGKTPLVEYLVETYAHQFSPSEMAVLSRGYGRKTSGFILADSTSTTAEIGDEPMQIFSKFHHVTMVVVCEKRVEGVRTLKQRFPELKLVILDDAFQHRAIRCDFNILVSSYREPFYFDRLLPVGRLRETKTGVSRADLIVMSKVSGQTEVGVLKAQQENLFDWYRREAIYTGINYGKPIEFLSGTARVLPDKILLVTGIVDSQPIIEFLINKGVEIEDHLEFPDHHSYTQADLEKMKNYHLPVLMTEKDATKMDTFKSWLERNKIEILALPMKIYFHYPSEDSFTEIISNRIAIKNRSNR